MFVFARLALVPGARSGRFIRTALDNVAPLTLYYGHPLDGSLVITDASEGFAGSGRVMAQYCISVLISVRAVSSGVPEHVKPAGG